MDPLIKKKFPIFNNNGKGASLVYLDNAATTQKPAVVINAIVRFYKKQNGNVHRGVYELSEKATELYEGAREKTAAFIKAGSPRSIVFTRGTTESINLVARSWLRPRLKKGDNIILTEMEHHSNIIPWQIVAHEVGAEISYVPINKEGRLNLSALDKQLARGTKMLAVSALSNVLGTINPLCEIIRLAHERGVKVLVDGAQTVGRMKINVEKLDCDFFAFSGHKMYGPTGIGVLYGKPGLLEQMVPFMGGGGMIERVWKDRAKWAEVPWKFEAGTPPISEAVGLSAAIDFLEDIGMNKISRHEHSLASYALKRLKECPGVALYGPSNSKERAGVISFNLYKIHPHDVAQALDEEGISLRAGHHCAQLLMDVLGTPASLRASFSVYNEKAEVDKLIKGLEKAGKLFSHGI